MRSIAEINEKIKTGKVVVVDAETMTNIVRDEGVKAAAEKVDVVTTGTFGPMCSSGMFFNVGHTRPKMRITRAWLNNVLAYSGIAAVDLFVGATELAEDDPANKIFPGDFSYGGANVIEDLVNGKSINLRAESYGTDCYPRKKLDATIKLEDLNDAILCNVRNGYQNYNVAINRDASRPIYTYMGILRPNMANANYCSAGQLSPLLNDPEYRTIGIGTRIFLGGGVGYVWRQGTQHDPCSPRNEHGVPTGGAGTLAVSGELKSMSSEYLRAASLTGYGVSLAVGIGVPIPILDEDMARFTGVADEDIQAPVIDYSTDYPSMSGEPLASVSYAELKSGQIKIGEKTVTTAGLSSYRKAKKIALELKSWIEAGKFLLSTPQKLLDGKDSDTAFHPFQGQSNSGGEA